MSKPLADALVGLQSVIKDLSNSAHIQSNGTAAQVGANGGVATMADTTGVNNAALSVYEAQSAHILSEAEQLFAIALKKAFPGLDIPPQVGESKPEYGDYQCNNALSIAKKYKGQPGVPGNPRQVGELILSHLPQCDMVAEVQITGPGFISFRLSEPWLASLLEKLLREGPASWAPKLPYQRACVDFSSPNVAKEMHVGHLRSTIIGDCIARVLEYCNVPLLRLNHIGDWGTQFGMLIQHMAELRPEGLAGGSEEDVADLQKLYKAAKKRFDDEEDFKERARSMVTKLQSGDPEVTKAWQRICQASRLEFEKIYKRLGVQLQERGESFYNPFLEAAVQECMDRGIAEMSDGAVVVKTSESEDVPPLIIRKRDGGYGYASTDLAAVKHRLQTEGCDRIIYVVDAGQGDHFDKVFYAARKLGWLPQDPQALPQAIHVAFGLVLGEDGKKIKSRSGDSVRLVELLDESKERLRQTFQERGTDIPENELEATIEALAYGAVKYADLKNNRTTNYRFSYKQMLDLRGNTAIYLEYTHARIASMGRKAGIDMKQLIQSGKINLATPEEAALARYIVKFPATIAATADELLPNRICTYLYDLSQTYTTFYENCKVLGVEQQDSRMLLCEATAVIMRQCFSLLGITPVYRI